MTMPSFRPLSTLTMRRTRAGTRGSPMIAAPSAASVGASAAPTNSASQTPRPADQPGGQRPAEHHGHRERGAQQPAVDAGVRAQLGQPHLRRVGEEHPDQGDLGEDLERLRLDVRLQRCQLRQGEADGDEDDRRRQVGALQPRGERSPAEERPGEQEYGQHFCWPPPVVPVPRAVRLIPTIVRTPARSASSPRGEGAGPSSALACAARRCDDRRPSRQSGDRGRHEATGSRRLGVVVLSALSGVLVIGLLVAAYALAPWDRTRHLSAVAQLVVWLIVLVIAVLWQIRAVLRSSHPWLRAVEGAALSVTLLDPAVRRRVRDLVRGRPGDVHPADVADRCPLLHRHRLLHRWGSVTSRR